MKTKNLNGLLGVLCRPVFVGLDGQISEKPKDVLKSGITYGGR